MSVPGSLLSPEAAEREHTESARDAERDATAEYRERRRRGGERREAFAKSRFHGAQVYRAAMAASTQAGGSGSPLGGRPSVRDQRWIHEKPLRPA